MKIVNKYALKVLSVAVGTLAGPGVLFALPYLLTEEQYTGFAFVLATSQLIMSVGGLGLDITCPRLGIRMKYASLYSLVSLLITAFVVFLCVGELESLALSAVIAWGSYLTSIFHSYILFSGMSRLYGLIGILKSCLFLMFLMGLLRINISPSIAWLVATLVGLVFTGFILRINNEIAVDTFCNDKKIIDILKFTLPMAIIIAGGSVPFVLDKVIAQSFLDPTNFSKYVVAATWSTPIIYLGNIIYQAMISSKDISNLSVVLKWSIALLFLNLCYVLFLLGAIYYLGSVPYYSSLNEFLELWGAIVTCYIFYSVVCFPSSAILQKYIKTEQVVKVAIWTALIIFAWLFVFLFYWYSIDSHFESFGAYAIVLLTMVSALLGISPKVYYAIMTIKKPYKLE